MKRLPKIIKWKRFVFRIETHLTKSIILAPTTAAVYSRRGSVRRGDMQSIRMMRLVRPMRYMRTITQRQLCAASSVQAEAAEVGAPVPGAGMAASPKVISLVDEVVSLNMLEVKAAEPEPEKTAFDLKLTAFDAGKKIAVIKEVRAMTGLGLKEAKTLVESAPKVFKTAIPKAEAEEIQRKLKDLGGTVELE